MLQSILVVMQHELQVIQRHAGPWYGTRRYLVLVSSLYCSKFSLVLD